MPSNNAHTSIFAGWLQNIKTWQRRRKSVSLRENQADADLQDNPWVRLQAPPWKDGNARSFSDESPRRIIQAHLSSEQPSVALDSGPGRSQGGRWLANATSPYGFSDQDGTLRDTETGNWRQLLTGTTSRNMPKRLTVQRSTLNQSRGSRWVWQGMLAAIVVGVGWYSVHHETATATTVRDVYQSAFAIDDGSVVWRDFTTYADQHQIKLPFLSVGALHLHDPLMGTIVQAYSATQPQLEILGSPGETILSDAAGTVTTVSSRGAFYQLGIDNGGIGLSQYTGIGSVAVKNGQYVRSGQTIGRLPSNERHPVLGFSLQRDGKYENPTNYIHFPTPVSS